MNPGSNVLDRENFAGLDVMQLKYLIDEMAKSKTNPNVTCETNLMVCRGVGAATGSSFGEPINTQESTLASAINATDRFILGLSVVEAHFVTFRKDEDGKWWKIDSKLSTQSSFENTAMLFDSIKKDYPHPYVLSFIIPDLQRVHKPPEIVLLKV
ncbi:MAG: hypothetical protein LLG04_00955 [Parachlamydia sp.]|nr:hypothetical protein [Parachlamydia sp.]